jgi:hypothetical protein
VVADALSRHPVTINMLTYTVHSNEDTKNTLILSTEAPVNGFRNQIFITLKNDATCTYEQPFTGYHRHIISITNLDTKTFEEIIQKIFSCSYINGIYCSVQIMGPLQSTYEKVAINLNSRYSQLKLIDVSDSEEINFIILSEHKRAHRNFEENKIQIIKKCYWPQMRASIKER